MFVFHHNLHFHRQTVSVFFYLHFTGVECTHSNLHIIANSNIAFQKPSNQTEDVVYNGWIWSADKAVDGCTDSDDPNSQECCSTSLPTQGQVENRWSVFLLQIYVIDYIIVIGRSGNFCSIYLLNTFCEINFPVNFDTLRLYFEPMTLFISCLCHYQWRRDAQLSITDLDSFDR